MVGKHSVSTLALGLCLGLIATGAQAQTTHHKRVQHHRRVVHSDARDARVQALEAEVHELVSEVRDLKANQQRAAAAPTTAEGAPAYAVAAPAPAPTGPGAATVATASNNPPASSPDTPRPVTKEVASVLAGGASILAGKPSISSPDGRFVANLHGVMQFDAADYLQDAARSPTVDLRRGGASSDTAHARDLNNGTNFRRARIGIDGKVYGDFEYNVLFDFGGSGAEDGGHVQELWLQYSGLAPFHLRVGAFTPSYGLEDQGSTNGMPFLERPAVTDTARSLSASDYREGAELWASTGRLFGAAALTSRLVGTVNSTATGTAQSFDQGLGFVGRLAAIPFEGDDWLTHVGVHGSYAFSIADTGGPDVAAGTARYPVEFRERPELRVDGTRLVDTGAIDADHAYTEAAEFAAQKQNFYLQAEYERFGIERRNSVLSDPDFSGYYVEGSWILTGERRKYNTSTFAFDAPPVNHPFDFRHGTWGAWELALRYSDLDLNYDAGARGRADPADGVRGGDQRIVTLGVNWYLNPIVRFMVDYQNVKIDRLSPNATTFATPVGAQIGQTYNAVAVRSQLAF